MRYKTLIVITVISIVLQSCVLGERRVESGIDDVYMYSVWNGVMLKYNIETGTATAVCDDPFCKHDDDTCMFNNINPSICIKNQIMYYCKYNSEGNANIISYNMKTGESRTIFTNADVDELFVADSYLFFWNRVYSAEKKCFHSELMRYDINSKKTEKLINCSIEERAFYIDNNDELIFWYNNYGQEFSTDYNYKNITHVDSMGRGNGNYVYQLTRNYETSKNYHEANSRSLYRINKDLGEKCKICEDLDNYIIIGEKIIYLTSVEDPNVVFRSSVDESDVYYNNYEGYVWKMDLDGANKEILCKVDCNIYGLFVSPNESLLVKDNYVGFMLYDYLFDGTYGISPNILIVNTVSGSYKITESHF